jgi:hypothetical protein
VLGDSNPVVPRCTSWIVILQAPSQVVFGSIKIINFLTGWWLSHPSEKYESVGMMTFPTEWKVIKFMFQTTNQLIIYEQFMGF